MAVTDREDARSRASREKIKTAFLELKKTCGFYEITVSAVCREAGISRGAFYHHYSNMAELLDDILDDIFGDVSGMVEQVSRSEEDMSGKQPFCHFVRDHKEYWCIFLDDALTTQVVDKAIRLYRDRFLKDMLPGSRLSAEQLDALFYFQFSGCFALTKKSIRMDTDRWCGLQNCIDVFLRNGLDDYRFC
jgi:AcrR family transcriptional regulator